MKNENIVGSRVSAGLVLGVYLLTGAPVARAEEPGGEIPAAEAPAAAEASPPPEAAADAVDWGEDEPDRDATKGLVKGRITSKASGEPLIEARVQAVGTPFSTLTDVDGNFEMELPPGSYEFRVWYELHQPQRVHDVLVEAGTEQTVDVALVGDDDAVMEVVVEAEADKSKAAVQMEKRKRAAVVMDAVSSEEMAKTPDSSAADAMKRVVGATVVDGKYLVVRGLGGRYTTTLLEGVAVPSPEPDMPAVPLDLFPSALLSSVTVAKTATPDLPGNFAGGALLIDSRQYPSSFQLKLKAGFAGDTVSTFQKGPVASSGGMGFFGTDTSNRGLPDSLPSDGPASRQRMESAQLEQIGESFGQKWGAANESLPANVNFGLSVGDTVSAFGNRLGYLASFNWGQSYDLETEHLRSVRTDGSQGDDLVETAGLHKIKLGGLGQVSYQLSPTDELGFISLFSRSADDRAIVTSGYTVADQESQQTQSAFIARQLSFNQLRGHHRLESAGNLEFDWQGNFSITNRDEPNTRSVTYKLEPDGSSSMIKERGGQMLFSELEDQTFGGGFDLAREFQGFKPKVGVLYSQSGRDYQTRRFVLDAKRAPRDVLSLGPDEIFNNETIGTAFQFDERTRATDSYTADFKLLSTYAMVDISALDPLRIIAGARFERARTELDPGSKFAVVDDNPSSVDRLEEDVLPSVNLVYGLRQDLNLRAAYAMTVARPQFRELAAASYYDFAKRRNYSGNPELERSRIHNADLRLEFFPGATEVLAASVFGKVFENPIEEVIFSEGGSVQPQNADQGVVYGIEFESRVGLYHLAESLRAFGFTANLTLAKSEVKLTEAQKGMMTNGSRPMFGQSPYALNLGLLYENALSGTTAQLLYNVFGPRLDGVGINGLDDTYEKAFHRLDLTVTQGLGSGFDMKLAATNLLDQDEVFETGDIETSRFSPGLGASASLGWSF